MMFDNFCNMVDDTICSNLRIIGCRTQHEQRPASHTHEQGNSGLVHSCQTLQSYTQIADNEENDDTNR